MDTNNRIASERSQEADLFHQAQQGCRVSLNRLMAQHERLVQANVRRQCSGQVAFEECLQAGRIGLWRAILGYQPERGWAFSSYAWPSISRAVWRVVREAQVRPVVGPGLRQPRRGSDPAVAYETEAVKQALHDLVARMPEPLPQVMTASYGLDETGPSGVRPIGARLGLSRERVRQLRQEGLVWLRHPGHSAALRTWLGRHEVSDYEQAYQQAQAWRQGQRRRHGH
jgi:RNA polymerase sigma factor (sigma-70 family)